MTPLVLLAEWLLGGAAVHVILRLLNKPSDFDQILNITGMVSLVIGILLFTWDWIWIAFDGMNQYLWGISRLIIDFWVIAIIAVGFKRILGVRYGLGVPLGVLIAAGLPFAIMFMRAPI